MITIDTFQPYGFMAEDFQYEADRGECPADWKNPDSYKSWVDAMAKAIADAVWPQWVPSGPTGQGGWVGRARGTALALTEADLSVMAALAVEHKKTAKRQPCEMNTNRWWFGQEDTLLRADWTSRAKCLGWTNVAAAEFRQAFEEGAGPRFSAATPWMLKMRLQRPRANQAAYWMGRSCPTVQFAKSALSSAAISGHAFQSLLGCLNVHLQWGHKMDDKEKADVANLAVDIGDRRVIAGIHYPSDNAMSWRVALETIGQLNRNDDEKREMRRFVIEAVRNSAVFQAMRESGGHADCVRFVEAAF